MSGLTDFYERGQQQTPSKGSSVPFADENGIAIQDTDPVETRPTVNIVKLPPPTTAAIVAETQTQIAKQRASQIRQNMTKTPDPRPTQVLRKAIDGTDEVTLEKKPYVQKMQSYKKSYDGKINYTFKKTYNFDTFDLVGYMRECSLVEEMVNTKDAPYILKKMLENIGELLEYAGMRLNHPFLNNASSSELIKQKIKEGYFDSEIEQASIELSFWFNSPWYARVAYKIGQLEFESIMANRPAPNVTLNKNVVADPSL